MGVDRDQRGILHRRQIKLLALFHEDRDRDLLHAAEKIAGRGVDRVHGDWDWLTRHRVACPGRRRQTPSSLLLRLPPSTGAGTYRRRRRSAAHWQAAAPGRD